MIFQEGTLKTSLVFPILGYFYLVIYNYITLKSLPHTVILTMWYPTSRLYGSHKTLLLISLFLLD